MDFLTIDRNIRKKLYKSTEALLSDVKWIVHNCYIYNNQTHPLTANAKVQKCPTGCAPLISAFMLLQYFLKVAKNEMAEIEVCPDCFHNFYVFPKSWFVEVCKR